MALTCEYPSGLQRGRDAAMLAARKRKAGNWAVQVHKGAPRDNKINAIVSLLRDPEWAGMADWQVAKHLKVAPRLVANVRQLLNPRPAAEPAKASE